MAETKREMVIRNQIADFLNVGTQEAPDYVLMGSGFNTIDENPSAQTDSRIYINEKAATTTIKSYQTQFPFDTDLMKSEKAVMALYDIGRNQKTGSGAEMDYVRVELFQKVESKENEFKARRFRVAVEVASCSGAGGEVVKVSGNLNSVGDFVDGTYNTVTATFTPAGQTEGRTEDIV